MQILFEETLYQDGSDGTPLVEVLQRQGIVPGAVAAAETAMLQASQQLYALLSCCDFVAAQEALPVAESAHCSLCQATMQGCPCCGAGIKVDKGVVDLPGTDGETTTQASISEACAC